MNRTEYGLNIKNKKIKRDANVLYQYCIRKIRIQIIGSHLNTSKKKKLRLASKVILGKRKDIF